MLASYIVLFASVGATLANGPVETEPEAVADASTKDDNGPYAYADAAVPNSQPVSEGFQPSSTPRGSEVKCKRCPVNETYVSCKAGCPTNYCPKDDNRAIIACSPPHPCPPGCISKGNYLRLRNKQNKCILAEECPPIHCTRPNEVWNPCPSMCLVETCDNMIRPQKKCDESYSNCRPRCTCKEGYFRNSSDICIPAYQCIKKNPVPIECIRTCANPNPSNCVYNKQSETKEHACQSKSGYILSELGGKCIKIEDCPKGCNGDPHAVAKECPVPCPATCEIPEPMLTCKRKCDPLGCQCESGYILSDGKCILPDNCKGGNPCGKNATFTSYKSSCPYDYCPVDDNRGIIICEYYPFSPGYPGCICTLNHKRKSREDDRCILSSECTPVNCTRQNEKWNSCPSACLAETCEDVDKKKTVCNTLVLNCDPKCVCKPGTYRNGSDICISAEECRKITTNEPVCGHNEQRVDCKTICPPQSCEIAYTEYSCEPSKCEPGCDCIKDHLRNKSGICIPNDECPAPVSCPIPSECRVTCQNRNPKDCAHTEPSDSNIDGCQCKKGYILAESEGNCIKIEDCPLPKCGYNEKPVSCKTICPPQQCGVNPALIKCKKPDCEPGCDCIENHLRNSSGICIPSNQCQSVCGHNEQRVDCKTICPPQSCEIAYTEYSCEPSKCEPGCDCIKDHLRNKSGICIPNDECPAPASCPIPSECRVTCQNRKPKNCTHTEPSDSNIDGCQCKKGYILSESEGNCIKIEDCPQPKCGLHEIPAECKRICPPQTCLSLIALYRCAEEIPCEPGCDCKKGYLRNNDGVCIPSDQCFKSNCSISRECRATCAVPNPKNCSYTEPPTSNIDGCQCQKGYVLNETDGKCVKVDECPQDIGCNGDPQAVIKECPWPCPSTCDAPNTIQCRKACYPIGCQCRPGYLLSSINGKCILPDKCKHGNPCGVNGTFSDCGFRCPNQYCPMDDDLTVIACKPGRPCPPGCLCNDNYKRNNYQENKCILASDCSPVNCTRPNEVWNSCPQYLTERCEDTRKFISCDDPPVTDCQPKCVCAKGYCRDKNDVCVYENDSRN